MKKTNTLIVGALLVLAFAGLSQAKSLEGSRPNIMLVMSDDQGMGNLSCMGNQVVRTPTIDRFHKQSMRFADFQVSPTCAPTRAAIMSGRAPFKNGVTHTTSSSRNRASPNGLPVNSHPCGSSVDQSD